MFHCLIPHSHKWGLSYLLLLFILFWLSVRGVRDVCDVIGSALIGRGVATFIIIIYIFLV